jgi:hypothetical protein
MLNTCIATFETWLVAEIAYKWCVIYKGLNSAARKTKLRISFLHTAEVHIATFDSIFAKLDDSVELVHRVEPDLLSRAREDGLETIKEETYEILRELADADAVVCTCSTLGPLADDISESIAHVFRIDRPVMRKACEDGEHILVAICLESTRDATLALLEMCAGELGKTISPRVVLCQTAWQHFEAGDMEAYAKDIAEAIKVDILSTSATDCVVLAQASMRVAEGLLTSIGIPVRSSPLLAAEHSIDVARVHRAQL